MRARPRRSTRLDRLTDCLPQPAFVVRAQTGRIAAWNAAAAALFGRPAGAAIGQPAEVITGIEPAALAGGEVERAVPCPQGGPVVVRFSAAPLDGRSLLVTCADLTGQRHAEEGRRLLAEMSRLLAGSLDHEATLQNVAGLAVPTLADWCLVDLVQGGRLARRLAVTHADPVAAALVDEVRRGPRVNDYSIVATALRTGGPVLRRETTDAVLRAVARDARHLRALRAAGFRSMLSVPLCVRERTLGIITFAMAGSGRRYDQADVALAEELARIGGLAVENARLYREARESEREARALYRAALAIGGELEPDVRIERILDAAIELMGVGQARLSLVDPQRREVRMVAERGGNLLGRGCSTPLGLGLMGRVVAENRPVISADIQADARVHSPELARQDGTHGWLGVPLADADGAFGVLSVHSHTAEAFGEGDARRLEGLGALAAGALREARLYREAREREREARALYRAAAAIGGELDLQTRLDRVLDAALELVEVDQAEIGLVDARDGSVEIVAARGATVPTLGLRQPAGAGLMGVVVRTNRVLRVPNMAGDPRVWGVELVRKLRASVFLGAPLAVEGRAFGVLAVTGREPDAFTEQHERLIGSFAAVAAAALREAHLYQQARDEIAARRQAEDARRESEARFRRLADSAQDFIYRLEFQPTPHFTYVSPGLERMLGVKPSEYLADPGLVEGQVHPDWRAAFHAAAAAIQRGELPPQPLEMQLVHRDGRAVWSEDRMVLVRDAQGRVVALEGVARDVTARKRAEGELRLTAERLERLIDGTDDAIVMTDLERRVLVWNRGAERMFGWGRAEVLGRRIPVVPPDREAEHIQRREFCIRTGQTLASQESERATRDGRRIPVLTTFSPLRDQDGQVYAVLGIVKDVSERKQLEDQSRRLALLEQRQQIAMDLHDGVIQSLYGIMLGISTRRGEPAESAAALDWAAGQLSRAIQDVRSYIRQLQPPQAERGLRGWIQELANKVQAAGLEPRLDVSVDVDSLSPGTRANLFFVAHELVSNAIRHAGARGVLIRLAEDAQGRAVLEIADDGRGFSGAEAAGNGLRNVAERARLMGARLELASRPGDGTTIRLELPLAASSAARA